ncbi:unnamed protein product [Arabidopsis halleri]
MATQALSFVSVQRIPSFYVIRLLALFYSLSRIKSFQIHYFYKIIHFVFLFI